MHFDYNNTTYRISFTHHSVGTIARLIEGDATVAAGVALKHPNDNPNRTIGRLVAMRKLTSVLATAHATEIDRVGRALMWQTLRNAGVKGVR